MEVTPTWSNNNDKKICKLKRLRLICLEPDFHFLFCVSHAVQKVNSLINCYHIPEPVTWSEETTQRIYWSTNNILFTCNGYRKASAVSKNKIVPTTIDSFYRRKMYTQLTAINGMENGKISIFFADLPRWLGNRQTKVSVGDRTAVMLNEISWVEIILKKILLVKPRRRID